MSNTVFLAQLSNLIPPDPTPLASPPLLQRLFLEDPAALTVLFAVAAVAVFFYLNARAKARQGLIAACLLAACGAGVFGLATAVTTQRERLIAATRELVGVTARVDEAGMGRMLADDARLFSGLQAAGLRVGAEGADKTSLIAMARGALAMYPVREQAVKKVQAEVTGPNTGTSQVMVRVVVDLQGGSFPHLSWWKITWREEGGQWRATVIEPLAVPGAGPI